MKIDFFCCKRIEEAILAKFIYIEIDGFMIKNESYEYYIKFCPFCGTQITIREKNTSKPKVNPPGQNPKGSKI